MGGNLISVSIYYRSGKFGQVVKVEADLNKIPEASKSKYNIINFKMQPLTWKMSNDLQRLSRWTNPQTGMEEIDWLTYKEKKLQMAIAGWDYKSCGADVPVTPSTIMSLHPLIAEALVIKYDELVYLGEDERKELVTDVDVYIRSTHEDRGNIKVTPPPEIIELNLMERFGWDPMTIGKIPLKTLQRLFVVMNQREASQEAAQEKALKRRNKG